MTSEDQNSKSQADEADSETAAAVSPDPDVLYRVLANALRRRLLSHLLEEPSLSVDEAADVLAGWQATAQPGVVAPDDRERIVTGLFHVHLPMLDRAGLVSYDSEDGSIRLTTLSDPVVESIRSAIDYERAVVPS